MKYKGLIFDLDGTLLYTLEDIGDSMNYVLNKYNMKEFSYEEYRQKIGGGFRNLVLNSLEKNKDHFIVDEMLKELEYVYSKNYLNKTKAYDGIVEVLEDLKSKNFKLAINTNKRDDYSKVLAREIFKNIEFIEIIGQSDKWDIKPDPFAANKIIDKMNLRKEEVIYIGDSNVDILTAKNTGIDSIGVAWGYRGEDELKNYGADYIAYRPSDIIDLVTNK